MAIEMDVAAIYPTERPSRERAIARLAGAQHGVVALRQLTALGLSASAVRDRVATGRLHRVHRGVYAVGHSVLTAHSRWTAAVLACGPGAVLSHRSAAALLGLRRTSRSRVEVTSPGGAGRRRAGIEVHVGDVEATMVDGIPCTRVARTLLDLAGVLDRRGLERAMEQAEILRVFNGRALEEALNAGAPRRGSRLLRALLQENSGNERMTRSELERRFLHLCREAGLAKPVVNAQVEGFEVDFHWPDKRLIVETDGHETHGTRRAFEEDRLRDQRLAVAGWRVIRFTWRQVAEAPDEVAATLRALLG